MVAPSSAGSRWREGQLAGKSALKDVHHANGTQPRPFTQPAIAARIERSGAGLAVPLAKLTAERLREAVARVLHDETFRRRAAEMQRAFQSAGGPPRAAQIVEAAVSSGQPVPAVRTTGRS